MNSSKRVFGNKFGSWISHDIRPRNKLGLFKRVQDQQTIRNTYL